MTRLSQAHALWPFNVRRGVFVFIEMQHLHMLHQSRASRAYASLIWSQLGN